MRKRADRIELCSEEQETGRAAPRDWNALQDQRSALQAGSGSMFGVAACGCSKHPFLHAQWAPLQVFRPCNRYEYLWKIVRGPEQEVPTLLLHPAQLHQGRYSAHTDEVPIAVLAVLRSAPYSYWEVPQCGRFRAGLRVCGEEEAREEGGGKGGKAHFFDGLFLFLLFVFWALPKAALPRQLEAAARAGAH